MPIVNYIVKIKINTQKGGKVAKREKSHKMEKRHKIYILFCQHSIKRVLIVFLLKHRKPNTRLSCPATTPVPSARTLLPSFVTH